MQSFAAIADPTRRRIVELLSRHDHSVGEIVYAIKISAPAVSQHLKILRNAGLVTTRIDAQWRFLCVNPAGFQEIQAWLNTCMGLWNKRMDALERALFFPIKKPRKKRKS